MTNNHPTLYLFVGLPGSGKTTAADIICHATGAEHIWADRERARIFGKPTHSPEESRQLYDYLNQKTAELLGQGKSVVFDTNFSFYKDRQHLREIAETYGADVRIIRLITNPELAKNRATNPSGIHARRNGLTEAMSHETFEHIAHHYEPLKPHEETVEINGKDIDPAELLGKLGLA